MANIGTSNITLRNITYPYNNDITSSNYFMLAKNNTTGNWSVEMVINGFFLSPSYGELHMPNTNSLKKFGYFNEDAESDHTYRVFTFDDIDSITSTVPNSYLDGNDSGNARRVLCPNLYKLNSSTSIVPTFFQKRSDVGGYSNYQLFYNNEWMNSQFFKDYIYGITHISHLSRTTATKIYNDNTHFRSLWSLSSLNSASNNYLKANYTDSTTFSFAGKQGSQYSNEILAHRYLYSSGTTYPTGFLSGSTCLALEFITALNKTTIPSNFAKDNVSLQSMIITKNVSAIGSYAFSGCTALYNVLFEEGSAVTTIPYQCFVGCSLAHIVLPEGLTTISNGAFLNCESLVEITIPNSVTTLGDYAFSGCTSLETVRIGSGVTTISTACFESCSSLLNVIFEGNVTEIGERAFKNTIIENIDLSSVHTIGNYAFQNTNLTSVTFNNDFCTIGNNSFGGCADLAEVYLNGVTSVGEYAFNLCNSIEIIDFGDLEIVGPNAFNSVFYNVDEIDLFHTNITQIGASAFAVPVGANSSVKTIKLPEFIETIGLNAFNGYVNLERIYLMGDSLPTFGKTGGVIDVARYIKTGGTLYHTSSVDVSSWFTNSAYDLGYYRWNHTTANIKIVSNTFGTNYFYYTTLPTYAFSRSGNTAVTLTTVDGVSRKYSGETITEVEFIGTSLRTLGGYAFRGQSGATFNDLPMGLVTIGTYAFYGCSGLTSVNIPSTVTTLNSYAFAYCRNLTGVTFDSGNKITSIPERTFYYDGKITKIALPDTVQSIGAYAFYSCSGMTSLSFGSRLTSISGYSFYYCSNLIEIHSNSVTAPSILANTFQSVHYDGTLHIPNNAPTSNYNTWLSTSSYYLGYYRWNLRTGDHFIYIKESGKTAKYYYYDSNIVDITKDDMFGNNFDRDSLYLSSNIESIQFVGINELRSHMSFVKNKTIGVINFGNISNFKDTMFIGNTFNNIIFGATEVTFSDYSLSTVFTNCTFNGPLIFPTINLDDDTLDLFWSCEFNGYIDIRNGFYANGSGCHLFYCMHSKSDPESPVLLKGYFSGSNFYEFENIVLYIDNVSTLESQINSKFDFNIGNYKILASITRGSWLCVKKVGSYLSNSEFEQAKEIILNSKLFNGTYIYDLSAQGYEVVQYPPITVNNLP